MIDGIYSAIVLSSRSWSASDQIISLLTEKHGRIRAFNYNATARSNHQSGALQVFNTVDVELHFARGSAVIKQTDIVASRRKLRENLEKMQYAALITELTERLFEEHDSHSDLYHQIEASLRLVEERNARIAGLAAAWNIVTAAGLQPRLTECSRCHKTITHELHFDNASGGALCPLCTTPTLELNSPCIDLLIRLQSQPLDTYSNFSVSRRALEIAESLVYSYIKHHVAGELKALKFIRAMQPD